MPAPASGGARGQALQVYGLGEAHAALSAIEAEVGELGDVLAKGIRYLSLRARLNVDSITYALAASITPLSTPLGAELVTTSLYGGVQEYGWPRRNIEPMGYTAQAIAQGWPQVRDELETYVAGVIERHGAGPDA